MRKIPSYTALLRPTRLLIFNKSATYTIKGSYTIIWQVRVCTVTKKSNNMIFDCFLHWFGIDDFSRAACGLSGFHVSFLISCPISGGSLVCFGGDSIGIESVKQKPSVTWLSIRSS